MDLKSKHSYQTQSFLWLLGFSWLLIVCFVGFQYHREKELRTELLDSQLQIINAQLEEALSNARTPHDFFDAHSDFFEGLRITLIDLDGTVVYDSEEPPAEMSNHLDRPEVAGAPPPRAPPPRRGPPPRQSLQILRERARRHRGDALRRWAGAAGPASRG